ncbi:hypothetical protein STEG23_005534, partial [Scotinomys teguina]
TIGYVWSQPVICSCRNNRPRVLEEEGFKVLHYRMFLLLLRGRTEFNFTAQEMVHVANIFQRNLWDG